MICCCFTFQNPVFNIYYAFCENFPVCVCASKHTILPLVVKLCFLFVCQYLKKLCLSVYLCKLYSTVCGLCLRCSSESLHPNIRGK